MTPQIQDIYVIWLLFLFLIPVIIFLKDTRIDIELLELNGLKLTPKLLDGNITGIENNYKEFIAKHPKLKKNNIVLKIFKNICDDAGNGISYNPNLYISSFNSTLQKFVLWILLGSHIPVIYLILIKNVLFSQIVNYQVCCYIAVYILEMIVRYKRARFSKVFYTNWYNKILNFDLLTVKLIRNDIEQIKNLSNSRDFLEAVNRLEGTNNELANSLTSHSKMLSIKLDELINLQNRMNGINPQSIILSLDDSIMKYRDINDHIQVISENIQKSFESIIKLSKSRKDEINSINKNSELLSELREQFTNYQSEAFKEELAQFEKMSDSLNNNVSNAVKSASYTIEQNFQRLKEGYDKFFDMCDELRKAVSANYEEKTASALTSFYNTLLSEFEEMRKQTEKTTEIIDKTSQATEQLCKIIYEFTQYTVSPDFMGKISKYGNFSNRLKEAAEKLISYEKLASLVEAQYEGGRKTRKRKTDNTGGKQKE
jgi:cytochrome c556